MQFSSKKERLEENRVNNLTVLCHGRFALNYPQKWEKNRNEAQLFISNEALVLSGNAPLSGQHDPVCESWHQIMENQSDWGAFLERQLHLRTGLTGTLRSLLVTRRCSGHDPPHSSKQLDTLDCFAMRVSLCRTWTVVLAVSEMMGLSKHEENSCVSQSSAWFCIFRHPRIMFFESVFLLLSVFISLLSWGLEKKWLFILMSPKLRLKLHYFLDNRVPSFPNIKLWFRHPRNHFWSLQKYSINFLRGVFERQINWVRHFGITFPSLKMSLCNCCLEIV